MFQQQMSACILSITGLLMIGVNIEGETDALLGIARGGMLVGLGLLMAYRSSRITESNDPQNYT